MDQLFEIRLSAHRVLFALTVAHFMLSAAGCNRRNVVSTPPPPTTAPTTVPVAAPPRIDVASLKLSERTPGTPDYIVGRIVRSDGKPLAMDSIRTEINVSGVAAIPSGGSDTVSYILEADKQGAYVRKLSAGTYRTPTARIEFPFNNKMYRLPLVPIHVGTSLQESTDGVVQDFVWQISGLRPGATRDPTKPERWIGGALYPEYVSFRPDLNRVVRQPPPGAKVVLTLTPKQGLADGTPGKPIVVDRYYNSSLTSLDNALVTDVPLAFWEVTGVEQNPTGKQTPLLFLGPGNKWVKMVTGTFEPDLAKAALKQVTIRFTRQEE